MSKSATVAVKQVATKRGSGPVLRFRLRAGAVVTPIWIPWIFQSGAASSAADRCRRPRALPVWE